MTPIPNVTLLVDEDEVSLTDFIKSNVIDEPQISVEELNAVLSLKVGKTVLLNLVDVKRVR